MKSLEERNRWRKEIAGGKKSLEERNRWRNEAAGGKKPLEERSRWRKEAAGGKKPLEESPSQSSCITEGEIWIPLGSQNGFLSPYYSHADLVAAFLCIRGRRQRLFCQVRCHRPRDEEYVTNWHGC
jgi:hypothetical protein